MLLQPHSQQGLPHTLAMSRLHVRPEGGGASGRGAGETLLLVEKNGGANRLTAETAEAAAWLLSPIGGRTGRVSVLL